MLKLLFYDVNFLLSVLIFAIIENHDVENNFFINFITKGQELIWMIFLFYEYRKR